MKNELIDPVTLTFDLSTHNHKHPTHADQHALQK